MTEKLLRRQNCYNSPICPLKVFQSNIYLNRCVTNFSETEKKVEKATEMKKAAKKNAKKDKQALNKDSASTDESDDSEDSDDSSSSDYVDDSPEGRHANMLKAIKHSKLDAGVVKQATECNKH